MEHSAASLLVDEDLDARPVAAPDGEPLEIPARPGRTSPGPRPRGTERGRAEGRVVFLLCLILYLIIAVLLDFKYRAFSEDAFSRMANGFYILYSRDSHLAAVGFVWTPLQSLADLVFLLGNHLWPALSHNNMAGSLVSSLGMAGAAYQVCCALREWEVSRLPRFALTSFFALNPMILFYAGNGMSEGLYLFTLVAATRYLLRWIHRGDLRSLAYAAVALAFGYLTRNEAILATILGAMVVWTLSFGRAKGPRWSRVKTATSDAMIFGSPSFIAAAGWAITSYVITGHFFEQFSSIYGNSQQELFLHHKTFHGRVLFEVHALEALWPLLPAVLIVAAAVAYRRRDPRLLAPLGVLGGALGFDLLAYLNNSIENFFRYFIVAVPLEVMVVGALVAALQSSMAARSTSVRDHAAHTGLRVIGVLAAMVVVLMAMLPATVTTGAAMFNPKIGSEEVQEIGFVFHGHPSATDLKYKNYYPQVLALGEYFVGLHLPDGDVVVDNSTTCIPGVLTTVAQPKLFVIPNDRDFQRILADPISFHAHFILEPDPASTPITAPNLLYPSLWNTGSSFTKMVHQFPARGPCPEFRLFHVLHHSDQVA